MIRVVPGRILFDRGNCFCTEIQRKSMPVIPSRASHTTTRHPHSGKIRAEVQPVYFTGIRRISISRGFAKAIAESGYFVYACSILPRHSHLVVGSQRHVEWIIGHLKARATQQLVEEGLHPFVQFRDDKGRFPSVWAHRTWKVFLDSQDDITRSIQYVKDNPVKEGKKPQNWSFVAKYPQV